MNYQENKDIILDYYKNGNYSSGRKVIWKSTFTGNHAEYPLYIEKIVWYSDIISSDAISYMDKRYLKRFKDMNKLSNFVVIKAIDDDNGMGTYYPREECRIVESNRTPESKEIINNLLENL